MVCFFFLMNQAHNSLITIIKEKEKNEQPAIQELNGVIKQAKQILMLVNHEQGFPR